MRLYAHGPFRYENFCTFALGFFYHKIFSTVSVLAVVYLEPIAKIVNDF